MKLNSNIVVAAALACGVSAQAQLLGDAALKKQWATPTEKVQRMDPKVSSFVKAQKEKKKDIRKVSSTADVLGRKGASKSKSKIADASGKVTYVQNVTSEEKMKVLVVNVEPDFVKVDGYSDAISYDEKTGETSYFINGKKVSKDAYQTKSKKWKEQFAKRKNHKSRAFIKNLTAEEIENEYNSSENVFIAPYVEPIPSNSFSVTFDNGQYVKVRYDDLSTETYAYPELIQKVSGLTAGAYGKGFYGKGVGVYFADAGCAKSSILSSYYKSNLCVSSSNSKPGAHATGVAKVLQSTAPQATIYGLNAYNAGNTMESYGQNVFPSDLGMFNGADIMIGSHSVGYPDNGAYTLYDYMIDESVYQNRVSEFVAAGNYLTERPDDYYVPSPGKALNVITVGAVQSPTTTSQSWGYNYKAYSMHKDPDFGNAKPEVANFTNFYFKNQVQFKDDYGDYWNGFMGGTSSSAPYTAGMAAVLMSQHSEFQHDPARLKAAFLAAGTVKPKNADNFDYDNPHYTAHIPMYDKLLNAKNYTYSSHGALQGAIFKDGTYPYPYREFVHPVVKGRRYIAAVSWINPGVCMLKPEACGTREGTLPTDIDLAVTINGKRVTESNSVQNPFEVVDFKAAEDGYATVRVYNYRNDLPQYSLFLGYSFVKLSE